MAGYLKGMNASGPVTLFDRALLRAHRRRAVKAGEPATFLLDRVTEELADRLGLILRDFDMAVDLGTPTDALARHLRQLPKVRDVIWLRDDPEPFCSTDGLTAIADEEALPLKPQSVSLIASALALQTVNDLPGTLIQIARALKPDGLFVAALLGGRTLYELRDALMAAEAEIDGGLSPRVAPFTDVREAGSLLQRAGLALPVTDLDTLTVRYDNAFALFRDLRAMGATNMLIERTRKPATRGLFMRTAEIYQERYGAGDGRIPATFEILYLSGWAPHESQQKPLRPGSAKARLAEALGTNEFAAGEKAGPGKP